MAFSLRILLCPLWAQGTALVCVVNVRLFPSAQVQIIEQLQRNNEAAPQIPSPGFPLAYHSARNVVHLSQLRKQHRLYPTEPETPLLSFLCLLLAWGAARVPTASSADPSPLDPVLCDSFSDLPVFSVTRSAGCHSSEVPLAGPRSQISGRKISEVRCPTQPVPSGHVLPA